MEIPVFSAAVAPTPERVLAPAQPGAMPRSSWWAPLLATLPKSRAEAQRIHNRNYYRRARAKILAQKKRAKQSKGNRK